MSSILNEKPFCPLQQIESHTALSYETEAFSVQLLRSFKQALAPGTMAAHNIGL